MPYNQQLMDGTWTGFEQDIYLKLLHLDGLVTKTVANGT